MKIILFNADDWGLSQSIHDSITSLHQAGAIDAAGIMMGQRFTDQAVAFAKKSPDLRVGLHLFATDRDCQPMTRPKWDLLWPEDLLINFVIGLPHINRVILEEVDAQLAAWKATGLPLHFVNSHFHFHAHHQMLYRISELLFTHFPDFKGWLRLGDSRTMAGSPLDRLGLLGDLLERGLFVRDWHGRNNDTLWGVDQTFANSAQSIMTAANSLGDGFHEFFFHPGRSWKLTDNGADHAALMDLAKRLPASSRNIKSLPDVAGILP